jgi:hypothetical protein
MPIKPENRRRYPRYWTLLSRFIRFSRAKGRCECDGRCGDHHLSGRCEERHGRDAESFSGTVRLAAAHLDHVPENDASVVALCQRCHLRHDRHHHAAERKKTRLRQMLGAGVQLCLGLVVPAIKRLVGVQLELFAANDDQVLVVGAAAA